MRKIEIGTVEKIGTVLRSQVSAAQSAQGMFKTSQDCLGIVLPRKHIFKISTRHLHVDGL